MNEILTFGCDPETADIGPGGWIHEKDKTDFDQNLALEVINKLDLLLGMPSRKEVLDVS